MQYLLRLIVIALSLLITTYIVPGFSVSNFWTALLSALVLSMLNLFIKPIITLLTLPITLLTLGLFSFVINALMLLLAAHFIHGFTITGFIPALLGSIVISLISSLLSMLTKGK